MRRLIAGERIVHECTRRVEQSHGSDADRSAVTSKGVVDSSKLSVVTLNCAAVTGRILRKGRSLNDQIVLVSVNCPAISAAVPVKLALRNGQVLNSGVARAEDGSPDCVRAGLILSEQIAARQRPVRVLAVQIHSTSIATVSHLILVIVEWTTTARNIVVPIVTEGQVALKHAVDGLEIGLKHANGSAVRAVVILKEGALHRDIHRSQSINSTSRHVGTQWRGMIVNQSGVDDVQHHIADIDDAAPAINLGAL